MKLKVIASLLIIGVFALFTACSKDEMIEPAVKYEMYYLDKGAEVKISDKVNILNRVFVRNLGEGGYYVFWPGDRLVKSKGLTFKLTDESIAKVTAEGVPDSVIQKAKAIKDKLYSTDKRFFGFLEEAIGTDNTNMWGNNFMNASFIPLKDVNGKDSIQFVVNNNYDDYLHANEKGYYNVAGVPLRIGGDNKYYIDYFYKVAGIHKVIFTATGVGNFGKDTKTAMDSLKLSVIY